MLQTLGRGMSILTLNNTATLLVASLLSTYPAQSNGAALVTNDFDLDNAGGEWAITGDWTDNGDGTFTKSGNTAPWSSRVNQNFNWVDGREYVSITELSDKISGFSGLYNSARPSNTGSITNTSPGVEGLHAELADFASGDDTYSLLCDPGLNCTISKLGLFDITGVSTLPVHILMVAGQSNAIGFGAERPDPAKDNWHPRVWDLPANTHSLLSADSTQLNVANEPVQFYETATYKVSPALAAARRIAEAHTNHRVLIIPVAKGGTNLVAANAFWNPNTTLTGVNNRLYDKLVSRYDAAIALLGSIPVASVSLMWSQGEADGSNIAAYNGSFNSFRTQLMTDLSLSELPTVIMGATIPDPQNTPTLNATQAKLDQDSGDADAISDVVYFDLAGTEWTNGGGDTIHFSSEAQRIRGDYAGQLLAHRLANNVGDWLGPRVVN